MNILNRRFPFSLRSLFIAVTITACYFGLVLATQPSLRLSNQIKWLVVFWVAHFPIILIWTSAILVCIQRWRHHSNASKYKYTIIGLSGLLMAWAAPTGINVWLARSAQSGSISGEGFYVVYMVVGSVAVLTKAVCWWLLLAAILGSRDKKSHEGDKVNHTKSQRHEENGTS